MTTALIALGQKLGWLRDGQPDALAHVMERLKTDGTRILLIYDNAIEARSLAGFLPTGGAAHVLITSNDHSWHRVAEPVEIRLWPKEIDGVAHQPGHWGRAWSARQPDLDTERARCNSHLHRVCGA